MTGETLSAIAGVVLSLMFSYVPYLREWFYGVEGDKLRDGLRPDQRRMVMGLLLAVVTVAIFGLSCAHWIDSATCDQAGAVGLVQALVAALVANQATYQLSPKIGSGGL